MSGEIQQVSVDVSEAHGAAKADFNFLSALAMPGQFLFAFPAFYFTLFSLLTGFAKKVERFAIGIPRGFAKTTFIKLICLWYIIFSHKKFILIVAANESKAKAILADICDMLSSPNIRRIFGHWDSHIEKDDAVTKVFHFRGKEIVLWAVGAQTSVRGINRKNMRPDVMVMDDIQDREDAKNPELAKELLTWMLSTLMMARSPFGCTYIFIGNMYPQNSILEKLKNNPQWTSFIVGGILADGTSLWEQLKPVEELLDEYESVTLLGQPEVFISEILNSTELAGASGIDISKIPVIPSYLLTEEEGEASFILIDPSSAKKSADDCTIIHFDVKDGTPIMDEIAYGVFTPLEMIETAIEMGLRRNTRCIGIEGVAYQSTALFWFNYVCEQRGIEGFILVEIAPKNQAKNNRIKQGAVRILKGEIALHPKIRSLYTTQLNAWNPAITSNKDDIIDPVGYVHQMQTEYTLDIIRPIFLPAEDPRSTVKSASLEELQLPF